MERTTSQNIKDNTQDNNMVEKINKAIEKFEGTIVGDKIKLSLRECRNNKKAIRKLYMELVDMGIVDCKSQTPRT